MANPADAARLKPFGFRFFCFAWGVQDFRGLCFGGIGFAAILALGVVKNSGLVKSCAM